MTEAHAPEMSMNRLIHAAVRRDLARLDAALADLPAGDATRAQELVTAYAYLQRELTRHHEGEDTHIWPMLAGLGVDATVLEAMETEHQAMAAGLVGTQQALATLAGAPTVENTAAARASVAELTEVTERHLTHEEDELEPLLRPHLDTPEWKAVEKQLRKGPLPQAGMFFNWLRDGMSEPDRAYLATLIPGPVVSIIGGVFGRRYTREIAPVWR